MVVGITGGIGSGKSFVAESFLAYDNTVYYHADIEAKKLMNDSDEIKEQVILEFGAESYKNNQLNRPYISSLVFKDSVRLQKLNAIVHPVVKKHFQKFIDNQNDEAIIVYENAILFEINSDQFCDFVIAVTAPLETRIQRVMLRDKISRDEVLERIKNQWSDTRKKLLCNYRIVNLNKNETLLKVQQIHNILTKKQTLF
ncbi:dephospho-CoA kinase [Pseudotenacibaculum sp. MALMAid0570]|uniref:dephospho-CoA kinase n=1 Tax=Pseudotenacibaculum sp. MALMAid0570 TaxID=3143938 RepID=UPI0032DEDA10